jgi:hypothetical protein
LLFKKILRPLKALKPLRILIINLKNKQEMKKNLILMMLLLAGAASVTGQEAKMVVTGNLVNKGTIVSEVAIDLRQNADGTGVITNSGEIKTPALTVDTGTTLNNEESGDICVGCVTVTPPVVPDAEVTINNTNPLRLTIGDEPTELDADIIPTGGAGTDLNWTSNPTGIAAVTGSSPNWTISGIDIGETTLKAASADVPTAYDEIAVKVYPKLTKPEDMTKKQADFPITLSLPVTTPDYPALSWDKLSVSSSNPSVVTYNEGNHRLRFVSAGGYSDISIMFVGYPESVVEFRVTVNYTGVEYGDYIYYPSLTACQKIDKSICDCGSGSSAVYPGMTAAAWYALNPNVITWDDPVNGSGANRVAFTSASWTIASDSNSAHTFCRVSK